MANFRDIKRQCTEFTDVYSQYVANQQRSDDIFQEITEAKGKADQADGALKEQLTLKYSDLQKQLDKMTHDQKQAKEQLSRMFSELQSALPADFVSKVTEEQRKATSAYDVAIKQLKEAEQARDAAYVLMYDAHQASVLAHQEALKKAKNSVLKGEAWREAAHAARVARVGVMNAEMEQLATNAAVVKTMAEAAKEAELRAESGDEKKLYLRF